MGRRACQALDSLLGGSTLFTLFLALYELGAGSSFGLLELSTLVTGVFFLLRAVGDFPSLCCRMLGALCAHWPLVLAFLAYLLWDALTLLYSPRPSLGWEKYRVVLFNLGWMTCLLALPNRETLARRIAWVFAGAGTALAGMAVLDRFWWGVYPILYTSRLTLRQDYNLFAMTILFGMALGYHQLPRWEQVPSAARRAAQVGLLGLCLPVLYFSGSRRAFLLLPFFLLLLLVEQRLRRGEATRSSAALGTMTGGILLAVGVGLLLAGGMAARPPQQVLPGGGPSATTAGQRYETLLTGGAGSKRQLLWRVAWQEGRTFRGWERVIGRGHGYDILLYDHSRDEALHQAYPDLARRPGLLSAHNLLLADYLGGGVGKVALLLALLLTLGRMSLRRLGQNWREWGIWCLCLWVAVLCDGISNRFGLLYDKYFCLFGLLLAIGRCPPPGREGGRELVR